MSLLRSIDQRWPGVNLRIACNRYLAATPSDTDVLAEELGMDVDTLRGWLRGNKNIYILGLNSDTVKTLEKYNKRKNNKKSGPDKSLAKRIKDYGVERYVEKLLSERRAAIQAAARTRSLT